MNTHAIAASAVLLACTGAARADFTVNIPGTYQFTGSQGVCITVPGVTGALQGIKVAFTYEDAVGSSRAYDVAFTINQHQWGGFLPFLNGADMGECPTGAPYESNDISYTSGLLGMGYADFFNGRPFCVGFGNANMGGGCTLRDVSITMVGEIVPTPGGAVALSLGGLCAVRRRRR
jgi:hypothetical protein